MSETRIVGDVLQTLNTIAELYAWRNNVGSARLRGRHVQFSEPGAADILAVYKGAFVAVECKTATGRQSAVQKAWQAKIEAAGGRYILARSAADALSALGITPDHPRRFGRTRLVFR